MLVSRIWQSQPGKFFALCTKSGRGRWEEHFFSRAQLSHIPKFLEDHKDRDIYFCPSGFDRKQRLKEYAAIPNLLWADLDEADPRTIKIKPTIALESSPGRYVGLWVLDREMNEDLNRRLTYAIGADKSGWDLTQVLRVPNTINYKYASTPRVRILWSDGPEYAVRDIERRLPRDVPASANETSDGAEIYKRNEKVIPRWLRRELMSGKPVAGKRSEMLWKMEQTLIEKGISTDEAFILIKNSPWNKFRDRRNGDDQLRRELDKAVNHHFKGSVVGETEEVDLLFRSMAEVEEENIEWLYYPYLALGELTILEGDPGLGKSYLMQMIASHICDGLTLPCVKHMQPLKGRVVYFDMENSAGTVTKKRLTTNGLKSLANFIQCEEPFSIDDEEFMDKVYERLEQYKPLLVVFDTVNTYLGSADAFKGHEAQQAFIRFREIAQRFNCSVVTLRHLTKSSKERALYRGQGSISFAGLARSVITVGTLPDDADTRVMAVTKLNVAKTPKALTFEIKALPDTLKEQDRSLFQWGEFIDLSSEDILATPTKSNDREDAKEFLREQLKDGPVDSRKLEKMAEARSIALRTLHRAADDLSVSKDVSGFGKERRSQWSLPDKQRHDTADNRGEGRRRRSTRHDRNARRVRSSHRSEEVH